jgi:hypothetical protein
MRSAPWLAASRMFSIILSTVDFASPCTGVKFTPATTKVDW